MWPIPAVALREDPHGVHAWEDDPDPDHARTCRKARQPGRGEGRQAVQQASHTRPLSERIGEGASGSCRLTRQGRTRRPERRLRSGGVNVRAPSGALRTMELACEKSQALCAAARPAPRVSSLFETVTLRCATFSRAERLYRRPGRHPEFCPLTFSLSKYRCLYWDRSLYSSLDVIFVGCD